jgi:Domain of unknown function (DUF4136)
MDRNGTMKGWKFFFWIGTVIAVSACSGVAVKSSAKYDPNIDYAGFKTFSWLPRDPAADALQGTAVAAEASQMIESELEKGLEAKGFQKLTTGKPDFFLNYHAYVQQKIEPRVVAVTCGSRICGTQIDQDQIREGTLILDIIQPDSKEVVWRGTAVAQSVDVVDSSQRKEIIETAVRQLLNVFPPK